MRFLQVIPSMAAATGGPVQVAAGLARGLAAIGHDGVICTVLDPHPSGTDEVAAGMDILGFRAHPPRRLRGSAALRRWLADEVAGFDCAVVHSPYLLTTVAAMSAAHQRGVPVVYIPHGSWDPAAYDPHRLRNHLLGSLYHDRLLRRAAAIWWTSPRERAVSRVGDLGLPAVLVPLGVDVDRLERERAPGGFRRAFPAVGRRPYVLFLGRLHRKKNADGLLEAFTSVAADRTDVKLVFAGPDHGAEPDLRSAVMARGLTDRVIFTGHLDGGVRADALASASAFVLPSHGESFGIAALEAMALGVPVIVSPHVGFASVPGVASVVNVAATEPADLAATISHVLARGGDVSRRAVAGASLARERFTWPRVADDFVRRLVQVLDAP